MKLYEKSARMQQCSFEGGIRDIFEAALKLESKGQKIYHLEIGRPDFDSPECAKKAAIQALEEGFVHYTSMNGIPSLREAIAEHERKKGCLFGPQNVIVTSGASEALLTSMLALLNPGDEIILPTPCFVSYREQALLAGAVPVMVPSFLENRYQLDMESIKKALTPRTKMIIINSPNNPTGALMHRGDVEELIALVQGKDIWVVTDECYSDFIYDNEHVSIASYPEMKKQVILVSSTSKTFSMTGWRIGYLMAPEPVLPFLSKAHLMTISCANSFAQVGAAEAYKSGAAHTQEMVAAFKERRNIVVSALNRCPGIKFPDPQGAFYVLPSIEKLNMKPLDFAKELMERYGVAITPGNAFGIDNHVRIAYAIPAEDLRQAMEGFVALYNEKIRG
ncbi:pyridoxal phosphate-dependent aminotransferase [Aminobacterium colombiense]